jgi:Uma2 family endonuclease
MSGAKAIALVSVDDYLAGELRAKHKHEYSAGRVYAMAGAGNTHNTVATSFLVAIGSRLRGRTCQPWNSDTKVRVRSPTHTRFYYPDAMVVCEPNSPADTFHDRPVVLAEVLSPTTRRIDEGEKRDAYLTIATLTTYLLVETNRPRVVAFERTDAGFVERAYDGLDAVIPLPVIGISLPLAELYERVDFTAAAQEERIDDIGQGA